jgi:hypothetical protein
VPHSSQSPSVSNDPKLSVDVSFEDLQVNYGPWTQRNLIILQKYYLPFAYRNLEPTPTPTPGSLRGAKEVKVYLTFKGSSTLRIPFRDFSKV